MDDQIKPVAGHTDPQEPNRKFAEPFFGSQPSLKTVEPEFRPYGKTPRWSGQQHVIITEKIDGTNALVHVTNEGKLYAGSRNRWLSPGKKTDNFGFAEWCQENESELVKLGPGWHYGEWWGQGIGRGYGLTRNAHIVNGQLVPIEGAGPRRILSLFNTQRFGAHNPNTPKCCSVVPKLYEGRFTGIELDDAVENLKAEGSRCAPGFMNVEGIIAFFPGSHQTFKVVLDKKGPSPIEGA